MPFAIIDDPVPLETHADNVIRVGCTRIPLETIVTVFNQGAGAEEIVHRYPSLELADVYSVIGYYLRNRAEVDGYVARRTAEKEEVRKKNQIRFDTSALRRRILERRKPMGM